jgi:hypothetical protein
MGSIYFYFLLMITFLDGGNPNGDFEINKLVKNQCES